MCEESLNTLKKYESPNVTWMDPDGGWPIVWESAHGCHVISAEGREYLDLTGAFGVAVTGHANPAVVAAGQSQMAKLLHAMGDVHPHRLKAELCRQLSQWTFEKWMPDQGIHGRTTLCNSGFEAVETALKTARLATGKSRVIAFDGGYHGLGYGALNATHRAYFRDPFVGQIAGFGQFLPFPLDADCMDQVVCELEGLLRGGDVGAVIMEPFQARGGIRFPAGGFLAAVREITQKYDVALILDEIYTGFGRTGWWFACESESVVPDMICLGKALTGGFPLSACVGRNDWMERAWPKSPGEALHTSTFLGHPVGCAMALAQLQELKKLDAPSRTSRLGHYLMDQLRQAFPEPAFSIRGRGLMCGLEVSDAHGRPDGARAVRAVVQILDAGYIFLPCGELGNVIAWTPPYTIEPDQLSAAVEALRRILSH